MRNNSEIEELKKKNFPKLTFLAQLRKAMKNNINTQTSEIKPQIEGM